MNDEKEILPQEGTLVEEMVVDEEAAAGAAVDLVTVERERDEWRDKAYRAAAEADNVRKRAAADVAEARQYALTRFAMDVLGVGDNLARALAAPEGNEKALRDGVAMTAAQLQTMLSKHGIAPVLVSKGDALNPELHQAMAQVESAEVAAGHIVQEVQMGFTLNGRLLRPAMVVVAKQPEARGGEATA